MIRSNEFGAIQGDLDIIKIDRLPADAKRTKKRRLAEGETTGHNHELRGKVDVYENPAGLYFVVAPEATVQVVHTSDGEHDTIEMAPGLYFVPREPQVEYDGEEERRVLD